MHFKTIFKSLKKGGTAIINQDTNFADILEKAMVDALTLIKEYMGDYEELDDSKLPELRTKVEQIKKQIIDLQRAQ